RSHAVLEHGHRVRPGDPLGDHRGRHRRILRQQLADLRFENASASDPFGARLYFGGSDEANAERTAFLAIPSLLEISLIGTPSLLCSRPISAHCSTAITLPGAGGVKIHP